MVATVAASKAYDVSGGALREDLEDIIYDISPMDTWFLTTAGRARCKSTTHEWLTDSLTAAAANSAIEGDAFSSGTRALPSRLKNYPNISRKDFEVTGTVRAVDNAGMSELFAYHTARAGKEIKRDMETTILANGPASAGTSLTPRVSAGVPNWLYTNNHIKLTGQAANGFSTTAPVSGFATATMPGIGSSATAFLEADLKNMLQQSWSCGGNPADVLCTASVYNTISAFTGLATRFRQVNANQQAQIIGAADVYVSAFGSHNLRLSRYIPAGYCYALDMNYWAVAYLRPFQTVDIAKIGDADRRTILAEWTLVAKNPLASTKAVGIS